MYGLADYCDKALALGIPLGAAIADRLVVTKCTASTPIAAVLTHPVDLPNLSRQLRTTYRLASERSSFRQQANYAQQVAMTAMTSMGELGVVLQFLSKCFACTTIQAVAQVPFLELFLLHLRQEAASLIKARGAQGNHDFLAGMIMGEQILRDARSVLVHRAHWLRQFGP